MKKLKLFAVILAVVMLFSSCAAVPENVQQDVDDLRKAHEESEKLSKELNYINVKDVYGTTPKTFEYKNDILNIDAKVCVPQAEEMYKLALKPNDLYGLKENPSGLFPDGGACVANEKMNIEYDIAPDDIVAYKGVEYNEFGGKGIFGVEWGQRSIGAGQAGNLMIRNHDKSDKHEHFQTVGASPDKWYFYNEITDNFRQDVVLDGKTYNALKFWKEFQNNVEALKPKIHDFDYKPYFLGIYQTDDEVPLWTVSCKALYEYKNVCFDMTLFADQNNKNYNISRVGSGFYQNFHCLNDDCMLALSGGFKVTEELEKHDKIIDLDTAVKIMQSSLAKERFANIESIDLIYSTYYYGEKGEDWASYYETPPAFFAEPFWRFKEKNDTGYFAAYYVNAFDGTFYSYDKCAYDG